MRVWLRLWRRWKYKLMDKLLLYECTAHVWLTLFIVVTLFVFFLLLALFLSLSLSVFPIKPLWAFIIINCVACVFLLFSYISALGYCIGDKHAAQAYNTIYIACHDFLYASMCASECIIFAGWLGEPAATDCRHMASIRH